MFVPLAIFLVLCGPSVTVYGLPATSDPSKDVEIIPSSTFSDQPIVDTGYNWDSPFGGLFQNIESIVNRMRQQMESVFNRIPSIYGGPNATEFNFPTNLPDNVDPSKINRTSVTKVINGHKVIVNDTEYKNANESGGAFFHIRVIDIKPDSAEISTSLKPNYSAEEPTPQTTIVKDRESLENSIENEIQKDREVGKSHTAPEKLRAN